MLGGDNLRLDSREGRFALSATVIASAMVFLDATVVAVALPSIQRSFDANFAGLQWIADAYLVTLTAFLLAAGSFGDLRGRRKAFFIGLAGFTAGSLLSGVAPNLVLLVVARALQGIGGAVLIPCSLAIITASFDRADRPKAIAIWASTSGLGAAVGPLVAGGLIQAFSWRWVFLINAPLAALAHALARSSVPESKRTSSDKLPALSALLAAGALGATAFVLIQQPLEGWSTRLLVGAAVALLLWIAFIAAERLRSAPMLPRGIFTKPRFLALQLTTLAFYFSISGFFLYVALSSQQIHRFAPFKAGATLLPVTVSLLLLSSTAARAARKLGAFAVMAAGGVLCAGAALVIAGWGPNEGLLQHMLPAVVMFGVGLSLIVAPISMAAAESLGSDRASTASAINNVAARLAGLLAIAILPGISLGAFVPDIRSSVQHSNLTTVQRSDLLPQVGKQGGLRAPPGSNSIARHQVRDAVEHASYLGYRRVVLAISIGMFAGALVSAGAALLLKEPIEEITSE